MLDTIELGVEELKGLRLTPTEISYINHYLSPVCNMNAHKAYKATIGEEAFKKMPYDKFYGASRKMAGKENVQTAIARLLTLQLETRKKEVIPQLVEDLVIAASYDPVDLIDEDGDIKGGSLLNIPAKLRQAVIEGVEVKYWGKDADRKTRTLKLTSKTKARSQLLEIAKFLNNMEEQSNVQSFTVNIATQNIEGRHTAEELLRMAVPSVADIVEETDVS